MKPEDRGVASFAAIFDWLQVFVLSSVRVEQVFLIIRRKERGNGKQDSISYRAIEGEFLP